MPPHTMEYHHIALVLMACQVVAVKKHPWMSLHQTSLLHPWDLTMSAIFKPAFEIRSSKSLGSWISPSSFKNSYTIEQQPLSIPGFKLRACSRDFCPSQFAFHMSIEEPSPTVCGTLSWISASALEIPFQMKEDLWHFIISPSWLRSLLDKNIESSALRVRKLNASFINKALLTSLSLLMPNPASIRGLVVLCHEEWQWCNC